MAKRTVVEVGPKKGGGWNVTVRGQGAVSSHGTKRVAVERGKKLAKGSERGQLVIKRGDGRVQTEHTYGEDPRRFKG